MKIFTTVNVPFLNRFCLYAKILTEEQVRVYI